MSRQKGAQKTGGRQKGSKNLVTSEVRELLKSFLSAQWPEIQKSFAKLDARTKVIAYTKLLPFIMPQYQSVNLSLSAMSESDLEIVIDQVKREITETE